MPATSANIAIIVVEGLLLLTGLILLGRYLFSRAGAAGGGHGARLEPWEVSVSDFLLFAFLIIAGGLLSGFIGGLVLARLDLAEDTKMILASAAFQIGLLIGPALVPLNLGHHPLRPSLGQGALQSGLTTFLISLPIVTLVNWLWLEVLLFLKLPTEQQDLLRLFNESTHLGLIVLIVALATICAPIAEELLFRATLFRFLRTRIPRWIALLLPGTIFAALHVNWSTYEGLPSLAPLITLAVIFSVAYERTGRISTAIIAHGLFNLHTIVLLLSGATSVME
jgi:membrane protease YdiL (CAAX protease family)